MTCTYNKLSREYTGTMVAGKRKKARIFFKNLGGVMGKRGFTFTWRYAPEIEQQMKTVYDSLSEKDRRIYAAIEAQKFPRGGITYIAEILGCHRKTIRRGIKELKDPRTLPKDRIRRPGGGAKSQGELAGRHVRGGRALFAKRPTTAHRGSLCGARG